MKNLNDFKNKMDSKIVSFFYSFYSVLLSIFSRFKLLYSFLYALRFNNRKSLPCKTTHKFSSNKSKEDTDDYNVNVRNSINRTSQSYLFYLLKNSREKYEKYCSIVFTKKKTETMENAIYLINDIDLISSIQEDSKKSDGIFQSQLIQPYLILDPECKSKLSTYEYLNFIEPAFLRYFKSSRDQFVNGILSKEIDIFISGIKETNQIKFMDMNYFIFRCTTIFLKKLFGIKFNNELTPNDVYIFKELLNISSNFSLGLFLKKKTDQMNEYSESYQNLLKLIEREYNTDINYSNNSFCKKDLKLDINYKKLKFLFIKNTYLDVLKIFSCISSILNDITLNEQSNDLIDIEKVNLDIQAIKQTQSLKCQDLWKLNYIQKVIHLYFIKIITLDLYQMKSNSDHLPEGFEFLKKEFLIGLNANSILSITKESLDANFHESGLFNDTFVLFVIVKLLLNFKFLKGSLSKIKKYDLSLIMQNEFETIHVNQIL